MHSFFSYSLQDVGGIRPIVFEDVSWTLWTWSLSPLLVNSSPIFSLLLHELKKNIAAVAVHCKLRTFLIELKLIDFRDATIQNFICATTKQENMMIII